MSPDKKNPETITNREKHPNPLIRGLSFLREHGEALSDRLDDLIPVVRVLAKLDDNLKLKEGSQGQFLIDAITTLSHQAAGASPKLKDALTHLTINAVKAREQLKKYWDNTLAAHPERLGSTNRAGGVYELAISPDHQSNNRGITELRQSLAASLLHHLDVQAHWGNKQAQEYLQKAKEGALPWQKQPELAHIKEPIRAKVDLYGAIPYERYFINDLGESEQVTLPEFDPNSASIRLLRPSPDNQRVFFVDYNIEELLSLDEQGWQSLLLDANLPTKHLVSGKELTWYQSQSGHTLREWTTDAPPPAFSLSLNAFTSRCLAIEQAATCGNSVTHLDASYGMIRLLKSHVPEDGASAKLEAFGVALAIQNELATNERPIQDSTPLTELRPPYDLPTLPDKKMLDALTAKLRKQLKKPKSHDYRDDKLLVATLDSLGVHNLRTRLPEFTAEQTAKVLANVALLNRQFTIPYRAQLEEILKQYPQDLDEQAKQSLIEFLAPEITIEHYLAIAFRTVTAAPIALNMLPLDIKNRLSHPSIPLVAFDAQTGKPVFHNSAYFDLLRNDLRLGKLSCNIYNLYKLYTQSWRFGALGAESLGEKFSPLIRKYMNVVLHISNLDSPVRIIGGKRVEISSFDTAMPDTDDRFANALALLINTRDGTIRASFRDHLTVQELEALSIDNSPAFRSILAQVQTDLCTNLSEDEIQQTGSTVKEILEEWVLLDGKLPPYKEDANFIAPRSSLILTTLCNQYHAQLTSENPATKAKYTKAMQIILASGICHLHLAQIKAILNMDLPQINK